MPFRPTWDSLGHYVVGYVVYGHAMVGTRRAYGKRVYPIYAFPCLMEGEQLMILRATWRSPGHYAAGYVLNGHLRGVLHVKTANGYIPSH